MNQIVMMAMAGCGIVLPVSADAATVADAAHSATVAAKTDAAPTAAHAENTSLSVAMASKCLAAISAASSGQVIWFVLYRLEPSRTSWIL